MQCWTPNSNKDRIVGSRLQHTISLVWDTARLSQWSFEKIHSGCKFIIDDSHSRSHIFQWGDKKVKSVIEFCWNHKKSYNCNAWSILPKAEEFDQSQIFLVFGLCLWHLTFKLNDPRFGVRNVFKKCFSFFLCLKKIIRKGINFWLTHWKLWFDSNDLYLITFSIPKHPPL